MAEHEFIPAYNVINVQVIADYQGQKIENVFNVQSGGGTALGDINRIVDKIKLWLQNYWRTGACETCVINLILARDVSTEFGIAVDYPIAPPITGVIGGLALPGNNTFVVKWSTGFSGRSFRGRTYHMSVAGGTISGGALTEGSRTFYVNVYNQLIAGLAAGGTVDKLCVVSKRYNKNWRDVAVVTPITVAIIDINLDSQRRRLPGRGT